MEIKVDEEKLKEKARAMSEEAHYAQIELENIKWEIKLMPLYERSILAEEKSAYKHKVSGLSDDEYGRYARISYLYSSLESFYNEYNIERLINREKMQIMPSAEYEYDYHLTKEEAYEKYCPVDRNEAQRIYNHMRDVDRKCIIYEAEIRNNYKGDLAAQLGYDKEKYEQREKESQEAISKLADKYTEQFKNRYGNMPGEALAEVMESFDKIVNYVDKQENEQVGMRM